VFLIHFYGCCIFLGIIAAIFFLKKIFPVFEDSFYSLFFFIYIYSFIFGKIFFLCADIFFNSLPLSFDFLLSGFSVFGASLGGIFAILSFAKKNFFTKKRELFFIPVASLLVHGFGRIGCFFADCCGSSLFSLPLQCVTSFYYFSAFFFGFFLLDSKIKNIYSAIFYYALIIFFERFVTDFFREDAVFLTSFFTKYQFLAASYLFVVIFLIIFFRSKH
jgi:phosphatidylglycerol:prolipoprotein diacylglycerol transferase